MDATVSAKPGARVDRLEFHLRLALTASMLMGYAVLFAAETYPLFPHALVVLAALAVGYRRFHHPEPPLFGTGVWTFLTLVLVLGAMSLAFFGYLFFMDALDAIFLFLPLIKFLTAKSERDHLQIFGLAFAQIVYGTVINFEISFGFVLAAYTLGVMWGLMLLSFRVSIHRFPHLSGLREDVEKAVFRRRYVGFFLSLGPLMLAATFLVFFILPRPGSALYGFSFGINKRTTGFADQVNIGDVGEIKQDHSVAMRVTVSGPPLPHPIYWRGAVLDTFDGMTWSAYPEPPHTAFPRKRIPFFRLSSFAPENLTHQTVFLDGIEAQYLLHAAHFAHVLVASPQLLVFQNETLKLPPQFQEIQRYEVWSHPESILPVSRESLRRSLRVPANLDPRIAELAERVVQGARNDLEKARRIEHHLKTTFGYSLKAGRIPRSDPLGHFLFESRSGHCEFFASAMTIMLRTLGIPARMVAGYQEGEFNEIEGYYIVRQSDAHAWVEANFGSDWVRFDPTPAAGWERYASDLTSEIQRVIDAFAFRWQRYVISFSVRDQLSFLYKMDRNLRNANGQQFLFWLKEHKNEIGLGLLGLLLPFLWLFRRSLRVSLRLVFRDGRAEIRLSRRFARLAKLFARRGLVHRASRTPAEYFGEAGRRFSEVRPWLERWLALFESARYSGRIPDRRSQQEMDRLETRIRDILSRLPRRSS